jgi:undecaprenyl diphosphate synthase
MPARYVAIIMDGNGRWAQQRGLDVNEGHREGARALRRTVENAVELDILELTAYAFSTENWTRPGPEVEAIMQLFGEMIQTQTPDLDEEGVQMRFIGRRAGVSEELLQQMDWAEKVTRANRRMKLFVAFNYGGRAEILDAAERYAGGGEEEFARHLYAPEMTDPDLLIRTSGERRLSNFLLWQCAYSELVFSEALWPDFDRAELEAALVEFEQRQRRFGAR